MSLYVYEEASEVGILCDADAQRVWRSVWWKGLLCDVIDNIVGEVEVGTICIVKSRWKCAVHVYDTVLLPWELSWKGIAWSPFP